MRKLFFILLFVSSYTIVYSQASNASDTVQNTKTSKEAIADSREGIELVGNKELIKRIDSDSNLILLDVRDKDEYEAGHIKGATWLNRQLSKRKIARALPDPNAEIIVYCTKGIRSAQFVKTLKNMGYKNVKLHVGLEKWVEEGYSLYNCIGEIKVVRFIY